jgi:hypothetical protein
MLNLFNNFYLMPANMGYYSKTHNFYVAVKPDEGLVGYSMANLPKAKCLASGSDLSTCFGTATPEEAMAPSEVITVLYADGEAYFNFLCRFLKTAFPSIDNATATDFIKFIGYSIKMISCDYYLVNLKGYSLPYSVDDLFNDYFNREVNMSSVVPFNMDLGQLGLDWLLYDAVSGTSQYPTQLDVAVKKAYTAALTNEINGVMGLGEYYSFDSDSEDLKTLAIQVGGLDISNGVDLCQDAAANGKLRTVKQLVDNIKTSGNISFFPHRCEYDRSNTYIVWLAVSSIKNGTTIPAIGK